MAKKNWYGVTDETQLITPALLVYPNRIQQNIESMIAVAKDVSRLIPHVKTYKMKAIVKLQMERGIKQFKCANLGEVEMLIGCRVEHILLAIQPTREKAIRLLQLQQENPAITFSTLVDNLDSLELFAELAATTGQKMQLWLDVNNGMNRTGILPEKGAALYQKITQNPDLKAKGVHVYDGHIRPLELEKRVLKCNEDFRAVADMLAQIETQGMEVENLITGGSPSFYPHSLRQHTLLSPGTTLLWDLGYQKIWKESPFVQAAVLATRLISKPADHFYCFDLGHKAVASEMPLPRVKILGLEGAVHKGQSEEHLILEYKEPTNFKIGDLFYAIPYHICPTVAKYQKAYTVQDGAIGPFWEIEARDYQIGLAL